MNRDTQKMTLRADTGIIPLQGVQISYIPHVQVQLEEKAREGLILRLEKAKKNVYIPQTLRENASTASELSKRPLCPKYPIFGPKVQIFVQKVHFLVRKVQN